MKLVWPKNQSDKKRKKILPRFLAAMLMILVVMQVFISNSLATRGLEIAEIEQKIQTFSTENADMEEKIASASAFSTIRTKAKDLGFTNAIKPIYLTKEPTVALDLPK